MARDAAGRRPIAARTARRRGCGARLIRGRRLGLGLGLGLGVGVGVGVGVGLGVGLERVVPTQDDARVPVV